MEIPANRQWMYNRKDHQNKSLHFNFVCGVEEFLSAARELDSFKYDGTLRCPCRNWRCLQFLKLDTVRKHLYNRGFQPDYYYWHNHGEITPSIFVCTVDVDPNDLDNYEQMLMDVQEGFNYNTEPEDPNPTYAKFHKLLCASQSPLWDGCEDHSVLSIAVRLMSINSDYNIPEACIDEIITLIKEVLPSGNRMLDHFYQTKKLISQLGCGYKKIDCCEDGCMLFRGEDAHEDSCKFCGKARFKENGAENNRGKKIPQKQMWYLPIIPRFQRLFSSNVTAKYMAWHHENRRDRGVLSHPLDGEAWKHFNEVHPTFASEPRNVRLGLCSDGFSLFNRDSRLYSCWPIIVTPYNLPPVMCMKREYMFLTVIVPGPNNPKNKIDVFLQPLIDDLKTFWDGGVQTYDVATKQNFSLRAALLWTINEFPAYGMLSGWPTSGRLGCPICMEDSNAFYLKNGRKISHFDCHRKFLPMNHSFRNNRRDFLKDKVRMEVPPRRRTGVEILERLRDIPKVVEFGSVSSTPEYGKKHHWTKKSIFWELPYWINLLNPHNIDVMHTESNIFQNVFNTVMNIKGKTKDNENERMDIALFCARSMLELEVLGKWKTCEAEVRVCINHGSKRKYL